MLALLAGKFLLRGNNLGISHHSLYLLSRYCRLLDIPDMGAMEDCSMSEVRRHQPQRDC